MPEDKSVAQVVTELWDLTKAYARQETVDPFKQLGRYVGYGFAGAVLLGFGVVLLLLALLRALQTETGDAIDGTLSFVPYLVVLLVGGLVAVVSVSRINKK